jgi:hypothetical protein
VPLNFAENPYKNKIKSGEIRSPATNALPEWQRIFPPEPLTGIYQLYLNEAL